MFWIFTGPIEQLLLLYFNKLPRNQFAMCFSCHHNNMAKRQQLIIVHITICILFFSNPDKMVKTRMAQRLVELFPCLGDKYSSSKSGHVSKLTSSCPDILLDSILLFLPLSLMSATHPLNSLLNWNLICFLRRPPFGKNLIVLLFNRVGATPL